MSELTEPSATELPKSYEPSQVEPRWYDLWRSRGYFTADPDSPKPPYCIVLPPPNVTGSLHLGHALTATIQDILIRYKRMDGFNCLWLPGTDHAGIATQMVVEREIQRTEKKSRHDLGREEFLKRVWAWKEKFGARIGEQHQVLGASLDWSRERFTMDAGVSRAVKEVFVRLHDEGLIYRARKLINWDPQLHTALSDLEVENEERQGSLWSIAYPVKGSEERLVVATTRPETMLGDTAVAVHPDDERYRHLVGKTVVLPLVGREIPIIGDAVLVDPKFGTGVVKVTPAHDHNDYATGLRHGLELLNIFTESAVVNENGGPYAGFDRFEARKKVLEDLAAQGLLVEEKPHTLPLAVSQRTGVPVEPRLSWQWYVKIEPLAAKAIAAVEQGQTRFVPESWTNTFFAWMRNIHDWCISRQLWWGHQIPAWYEVAPDGTVNFETARYVVAREKPEQGTWVQDPDVLDTWFSSGLWPFSTLGWPDQTRELATFYPNSVMETGHDIIFFWVARMMMMGLHFMGEVPFRVVYLHAMVRDEKGEKMSKTKGNVIDPLDIVRGAPAANLPPSVRNRFPQGMPAMGADALRFTLASLTQQGRDIKLSVERIAGYKAFCNKLWNAARFALMNLGDFQAPQGAFVTDHALSLPDRWILSRLDQVVAGTRAALDGYQFAEAASLLYQFLWRELCDWYIELAKGALTGADPVARDAARAVLVHCLDQVLRLLHPFMPFITEEIWQRLPFARPTESICLAAYPVADARLRDLAAETEMAPLVEAIEGLRTIRGESNLSPALRIAAHIQVAEASVRDTLERGRGLVMALAGLASLEVGPLGAKPAQAAAEIRAGLELYVPLAGLVDLGEERDRLRKEIEKAGKEIAQIDKKFENPNFAARAPAEVVEKDKARRLELEGRIAKLEDSARRIAPVEVPAPPPVSAEPAPAVAAPGAREEAAAAALALGLPDAAANALAAPSAPGRAAHAVRETAKVRTRPGARGAKRRASAGQAPAPASKKPIAKKPTPKKPTPKKPTPKKPTPKSAGGARKAAAAPKTTPKKAAPPRKAAPKVAASHRAKKPKSARAGAAAPSRRAAPARRSARSGARKGR
jgi:valyl-tRNA synthetase